MLTAIRAINSEEWYEVTTGKLIASSLGLLLLFVTILKDNDKFIFLLDHTNLVFHEAGHMIFGLFGRTIGLYGGTMGQLVFPLVALVAFWLRREAVSFAIAGVWFFENYLNIAHYMADARAQILPLVGGGGHDWNNIFSRWGVLSYDTKIAALVNILGWLGIAAMWAWLFWRWHEDRQ
jgi:hypothetical protein